MVSVLPDPLSPTTPTFSPGRMSRSTPRTISRTFRLRREPIRTPRIERTGVSGIGPQCSRATDLALCTTRPEGARTPVGILSGTLPGVMHPRMVARPAPVHDGTEPLSPDPVRYPMSANASASFDASATPNSSKGRNATPTRASRRFDIRTGLRVPPPLATISVTLQSVSALATLSAVSAVAWQGGRRRPVLGRRGQPLGSRG